MITFSASAFIPEAIEVQFDGELPCPLPCSNTIIIAANCHAFSIGRRPHGLVAKPALSFINGRPC